MDVGAQTMEKISGINGLAKVANCFLVLCLVVAGGCVSKKVMEDSDGKFGDIEEEYSKVVKVKELPTQVPTPVVSQTPPDVKSVAAGPDQALDGKSKSTKKDSIKSSKQTALPATGSTAKKSVFGKSLATPNTEKSLFGERLPDLEDAEGFSGRRPLVDPFRVGEIVTLNVNYFNMVAGDVNFEVKPFVTVNGKKSYHFAITAKTNKFFNVFYALENQAETFVDFENLTPHTVSIDAKESARLKEVRTFFDHSTNTATQWEKTVKKDQPEKKKKRVWTLESYTQNVISAIFYVRNFTLTPGKKLAFRVADDGKNYVFKGEVLRREVLKTDAGSLNTVVMKINFELEDQLKPSGENILWFTDDDRKLMVRVESKVKIGTIVAKLKNIQ